MYKRQLQTNIVDERRFTGNVVVVATRQFFFAGARDSFLQGRNLGEAISSRLTRTTDERSILGGVPFGFNDGALIWSITDITGGGVGAVSEVTVDPSDSFFVIENTTLPDVLGATTVDGDTLWTANTTNDTIVLSTSAPGVVPEPSSAILCFFAGIGLLRRKR